MGRNGDNISKSNKLGYKKTILQLKMGSNFTKILTKPSSDVYIDDKSYDIIQNGKNLRGF